MVYAKKIILRNINKCGLDDQLGVLKIRNQPEIREAMFTSHLISESEHKNWLSRILNDPEQKIFIIYEENSVRGVVSLSKLDLRNQSCDWAFYLDVKSHGNGIGATIEFAILNYVFMNLGLMKLNCEVLESNPSVVRLHNKFGFKEEGFGANYIERNGKMIGVHRLGITNLEWLESKKKLIDKIGSILNRFEIIIE